jgi:hypothetical protein
MAYSFTPRTIRSKCNPAAFGFLGERVEAPRYIGRGVVGCGRIAGDARRQHAGDGGLLDDLAIVAAVQAVQQVANDARFLDHPLQVRSGAFGAVRSLDHHFIETGADQVILERALVLQILLGLAAVHLVERRLRDIEVAALDQFRHLPVEECQQQRADMGAVHVRVRHDDDLVIAQLVGVEFLAPDAGAERGDQRPDFLTAQHLVETRALDIQDLAAQRQHGLEFAVTALLGGAAGGIALDDEELGLGRIALLAIGELAG